MAINFTDSPADGATQVIGGRTYTYNSAKNKWDTTATEVVGPTATVYATVDNLPGTATTGDQAFVSGTNRLYIWNGSGWYNIALVNNTPTISGVSSSYDLAIDGTATVITITATDPEGLPITYSIASDTSGNIATVTQGTGASSNVFTITPSTNDANAGTFSLTFRATDGINVASAISSFTLQFRVQNSSYTTALITSVGANNAVNNTFDDKSSNDYSMTVNGNTNQTTFSPYRHGGYSTYFDGAGDYLSAVDHADFDMGTGNFTIELWMYADSQSTSYPALVSSSNYNSAGSSSFRFDNTGQNDKLFLYCNSASPSADPLLTSSSTLSLNEWHHVALVRDGTSLKFYVDGTENGSVTIGAGQTFDFSVGELRVGRGFDVDGVNGYFTGHIIDLRIVKGTAVYTSAFTPPTERLTAITNTSLLTCHLPYIADGSTNDHSITINGDTSTQPFSPYDYQEYSSSTHSGSAYFDGNGDSLNFTTTGDLQAMGRSGSACTVEAWVYLYSVSANGTGILAQGTAGSTAGSNIYEFGIKSDRRVRAVINGGYSNESGCPISTGTIPFKVWTHLAWVLHNQTWTIYINGKADGTATGSYPSGTTHNAAWIGRNHYDAARTGEANIADLRVNATEALYTSNFTPPTAPSSTTSNTVLHMPMTDAGIIDKSQSVKTITLSGGTVSSTSQTKYLSSSIKFDGVDDQITIPQVNIGASEDFTIECWHYLTSRVDLYPALFGNYNSFTTGALSLFVGHNNSTTTSYQVAHSGTFPFINAGTINYNQWVHVALVRSGTTMTLYIDGTSVGSGTSSVALNGVGNDFFIGRIGDNASGHIEGYISDFRITKGLARYTANFTPPTSALRG